MQAPGGRRCRTSPDEETVSPLPSLAMANGCQLHHPDPGPLPRNAQTRPSGSLSHPKELKMSAVFLGQGLECKGTVTLRRHMQAPRHTYVCLLCQKPGFPSSQSCTRGNPTLSVLQTLPPDRPTNQPGNVCHLLGTDLQKAWTLWSSSSFSSSSVTSRFSRLCPLSIALQPMWGERVVSFP